MPFSTPEETAETNEETIDVEVPEVSVTEVTIAQDQEGVVGEDNRSKEGRHFGVTEDGTEVPVSWGLHGEEV